MIKCKKCGNELNERGKNFDIFLTDKQQKQLQEGIFADKVEAFEEPTYECLKCHAKLSLMDLIETVEDDVVICKTSEDINKHMPELNKATLKRR